MIDRRHLNGMSMRDGPKRTNAIAAHVFYVY
jgi:hypothetical protein